MFPAGPPSPALKLLVVHSELPIHDRDALSLRLFNLVRLLVDDGHRVTYFGRQGLNQVQRYREDLERAGAEVLCWDPARLRERGLAAGPPELDLEGFLERERFDVAILSTYEVCEQYTPYLRRCSPDTKVVLDTTDVHHVRELRGAQLTGDAVALAAAELTRVREQAACAAADAVIAVSEDDARVLRALAPAVPAHIVSVIHDDREGGPPCHEREGLVFVGNFRHAPNVDAMRWFVDACWPLVRRRLPGVRLSIVGSGPPPDIRALAAPDVVVTGQVPEVAPYLDAARVSIAPLRFGAGVKTKIAEAISHGLPVVTTTIGAEGMELEPGRDLLVADDPEAFADHVVALYGDPALWRALVASGRERVAAHLSSGAARAALAALLEDLAPVRLVAPGELDDDALRTLLAGYLDAFGVDDAVTLALAGGADPEAFLAEVAVAVRALGRDPEAIPDVEVAVAGAMSGGARTARLDAAPRDRSAWREARAAAARGVPRRRRASIVVRAGADVDASVAQLGRLAATGVPDDVEVLVALDGAGADVEARMAATGASVLATRRSVGRRGTLQRAAAQARGDVVVALEPHARPRAGFLEPLLEAARDEGTALAGPVVAGAHGLRVAADGSLWPRLPRDADAPDALALDCLAARRELWLRMPSELPARDGMAEAQLGAWAARHGALRVVGTAAVDRATPPPASIIVCTRDRADELPDNIALLVASGVAAAGAEIVVVDNASTDATGEVALELAARHPGLVTVTYEPNAGLCHARNAGAAAATHDLLLYVDDDARPAPGWLEGIAHELARPGVVNVGGPIRALWPQLPDDERPAAGLERLFSVLDLGDRDRDVVPPEYVYGANWAVRRSALDAIGGFDPTYGPSPTSRINGDETTVALRLHEGAHGTTRWVGMAAVGHRIASDRVDPWWMLDRSFCVGVERVRHNLRVQRVARERLLVEAERIAGRMLALLPLEGRMEVEEVLETMLRAPMGETARVLLADAFGWLVACAVLLGEDAVEAGLLHLAVRPEHAEGVLRPRAAAR